MPTYTQNLTFGAVAGTLPTKQSDGTNVNARYDGYGHSFMQPMGDWRHNLNAAGAYFSIFDATLDVATTIAGHAAPVLADIDATLVKGTVFLRNIATSTTKRWHLDWLRIHVKTAGANGTSAMWAAQMGTTTRYTSGGTALTVSNTNMSASNDTSALLTALGGPIVIAAENATTRRIGHGLIRDGIEVAGDSKTFVFGGNPLLSTVEAASGTHDVVNMPPVSLGAGDEFILGIAAVAQNVAGVYGITAGAYYI